MPLNENDFIKENKKIFLGHKTFNDFNDKDIFDFTILRNPIDLYISLYFSHLNFDKKNNYKKTSDNIENILSEWDSTTSKYTDYYRNNKSKPYKKTILRKRK